MRDTIRKLPIGVQTFEKLRREGYLYVDKTAYIYDLVHSGAPYFLSRPRRFGKSLFLSTLRAYWEGKKELFEGLVIEKLEAGNPDAWQEYPVFYFDFNKDNFKNDNAIEAVLDRHLCEWEKKYAVDKGNASLAGRFQQLIVAAKAQTGKSCVVLVDEYDKSLLETMVDQALADHNKDVFKGFFSTLKSYDGYLRFVFLTGVTKFNKVSIFSDLNHLRDISMNCDYADICGITDDEIRANFMPEIETMAKKREISVEECLDNLKDMYDGYKFHQSSKGVYNPFSLINALADKEYGSYWFATGTPTFLTEKLKSTNFNIREFTDKTVYARADSLSNYRVDSKDLIPLLYQTGYLTINAYDEKYRRYQLGYPNREVEDGFINSLAPFFLYNESTDDPLSVWSFLDDLQEGDSDSIRDRIAALFARIPYRTDGAPFERDFQNVIYITFMLLGQFVHTETHSAKGRCDCVVETDDYIYLFEFKCDGTAQEALEQIEDKGYVKPYAADKRKLLKIGAAFSSEERNMTEWRVADINIV